MSSLPYQDDKPVGAPDFYFGINSTFRFIRQRRGDVRLLRYWRDLGTKYMAPVTELWTRGGLPAVALYWRDFFAAEPGSEVHIEEHSDHVSVEVTVCPAIRHLREHGREIEPRFCQHCYFVSEAAGQGAGITVRVEGGGGSCRQTFWPVSAAPAPQSLEDIVLIQPQSEVPHAGRL